MNDYLQDTFDKINSLEYCVNNDIGEVVVDFWFLNNKLSLLKMEILAKKSKIKIGVSILSNINKESKVLNNLSEKYQDLYLKLDMLQSGLNENEYHLTSHLIEYLSNV